jgi:hypothetical protein
VDLLPEELRYKLGDFDAPRSAPLEDVEDVPSVNTPDEPREGSGEP